MALRVRWEASDIAAAVAASKTLAEVARRIGARDYRPVARRMKLLGISGEHLLGYGWSRGCGRTSPRAIPIDLVLVAGRRTNTTDLKKRLYALGLKTPQCEACKITHWQGKPAPLELDHISGDKSDNRIENLRVLCANCHAQTPTYSGKNIMNMAARSQMKPARVAGCIVCGATFEQKSNDSLRSRQTCSDTCLYDLRKKNASVGRVQWPKDDALRAMVWERPVSRVAVELGVSDTAIKKRCRALGIATPPRGHWSSFRKHSTDM